MMVRLMVVLSALAAMAAMGCGDDVQTDQVGVTPAEMAADERTVEAKRTAFALEQETSTPTPTVPLQPAVMPARTPARESAAVEVVRTPLVVAEPTVEPTATAEPTVVAVETATPETGGEMDAVRIPRDVLIGAFGDALQDIRWGYMERFENVSELLEDTEFGWSELPWGELTYVGREIYDNRSDRLLSYEQDMVVVSVFGNGLGDDPVPGYGGEVHELYRDNEPRLWVASDVELWRDENERLRNLLNAAFNGNLVEMELEKVDLISNFGLYYPFASPVEEIGEDEGTIYFIGDFESGNLGSSRSDIVILYFSREGYDVWIAATGRSPEREFFDIKLEDFVISILGNSLDSTLLRLLEEYP